MADNDPIAGIAEPHQSTVATILRAVGQDLLTAAEADVLIDRIRAHMIAVPVPVRGAVAVPVPVSDEVVFPR